MKRVCRENIKDFLFKIGRLLKDKKIENSVSIKKDKFVISIQNYKLKDILYIYSELINFEDSLLYGIVYRNIEDIYEREKHDFSISSNFRTIDQVAKRYRGFVALNRDCDKVYLYCSKCGVFEESKMDFDIVYSIRVGNIKRICKPLLTIKKACCSSCGHIYSYSDLLKEKSGEFGYIDYSNSLIDKVEILENNDKINILFNVKNFAKDLKIKNKYCEITLDLEKGISYFNNSNIIIHNNFSENLQLTEEEAYKVVEITKKYYKNNDIKSKPFKEYIKTAKKDNYLYNLIIYNMNPCLSYREMSLIANNKRSFIELNHSSRRGLEDYNEILCEIYNKLGAEDRQDINFILNTKYSNISEVKKVNKQIKDINNKIKIYNSEDVKTIVSFLESKLYQFLLKKHNETTIINQLIKTPSTFLLYDLQNLYDNVINIKGDYELKYKKLKLTEIHDILSKDLNFMKLNKNEYIYSKEILEIYNKEINNIQFKIIDTGKELNTISRKMKICVDSYDRYIEEEDCIIIGLKKEDKYIGCLEISRKNVLKQAKGHRNTILPENVRKTIMFYCEENKIEIQTSDMLQYDGEFFGYARDSFLSKYRGAILEVNYN